MDRQQVNLRLDGELISELDELARLEHLDRPELARRILREGVARHREERALSEYAAGRVTAWRAAEMAGLSLYDMLDRIHERGVVHEMDPEEVAAIRRLPVEAKPVLRGGQPQGAGRRVAEASSSYLTEEMPGPAADAESRIDALRTRFQPVDVRHLMVGESSPAGGTHFYLANSNLFRAIREAFAVALAPAAVPTGEAFLAFFADRGYWLVDLADEPVNRMAPAPRREAVEAGVARLQATIEEAQPETIVAIKATVGRAVRQAALAAGSSALVDVLPFPVRQWRTEFVTRLAGFIKGSDVDSDSRRIDPRTVEPPAPSDAEILTQRITSKDLEGGRIRISGTGRGKSFFPSVRGRIDLLIRGQRLNVHYDPHHDADQERSGVVRVGAPLASLVRAEERLRITRSSEGLVSLD